MYRLKSITGVKPAITRLHGEAMQEARHTIEKLTEIGSPWKKRIKKVLTQCREA
jgi:hypothetical protein